MVERKKASDVVDRIIRVTTPIVVAIVTFGAWQGRKALDALDDHESRLVNVEATRFTAKDAADARARDREDMKEFIRLNITPIRASLEEIKIGVKENRAAIRDTMR